MKFPLSIIADYLANEGFTIARKPKNLSATFDWISTLTSLDADFNGRMLIVASAYSRVSPDVPAVLVSVGEATTDRNNVFLITHTNVLPGVIAERLQMYLREIYVWIEDMHHMLGRHCTCSDLLERSEPVLKNYISVTDSTFSYIAHTPHIGPIEEASRYLLEHGRYSKEVTDTVRTSGLAEMWATMMTTKVYESNPIDPLPSIEHVYHLNNQYAAHLVMVCPKSITKGQEFLFGLLVGPIGTVLSSNWETNNPFKQNYSTFISNLLNEDASNRKVTYEQAQILGIPTEGLFKICVIGETWRDGSSARFAARTMTHLPECKVIVKDDLLVLLLCVGEGQSKRRLSSLEERVFELVESLDTQVGVSRKFFDLMGASGAYDEAKIALHYGKLHYKDFLTPGENHENNSKTYIYRFKRYLPYYVGDPNPNKNTFLQRYGLAAQILGKIEQDDVDNATHDAKILRAYLYSGYKVSSTCEMLGMHRNSIMYRLRHIEKTYDLDLNDNDERMFLNVLFLLPR